MIKIVQKILFLIFLPQLLFASYPVAVFHGLGDLCLNINNGFAPMLQGFLNGTDVVCIESGASVLSIVGKSFISQAEEACENLKKDERFNGKDISVLGLSQGSLIARYIAQNCDFGGSVKRMVSIGGPQMGVSMIPQCSYQNFLCRFANNLVGKEVYSSLAQRLVGPAGYFRDQYEISEYLQKSTFLSDLNNEKSIDNGSKQNMINLENLTLVMFDQDTMIVPKETAWFQSYADNSEDLQKLEDTDFYKSDKLGLKTLNEAGKINKVTFAGNHLQFSQQEIYEYIVPVLI